MQVETLDPKVDLVFRALFGSERNVDILRAMLNAVLGLHGNEAIEHITFIQTDNELEYSGEKYSVVDLVVRDGLHREFVVEMQCRNHAAFPERILYYGARRLAMQLRSGEHYQRLRPVVVLVFTDFTLMANLQGYLHRFMLREATVGRTFSKYLELVLVQLPKFPGSPSPETATEQDSAAPWIKFLKEGSTMSSLHHEPWVNPHILRAIKELERLAADETMREVYERRLLDLQLRSTELHESYEEGKEDGLQEGRKQGELAGAARAERATLRETLDVAVELRFGSDACERVRTIADAAHIPALRAAIAAIRSGEPLERILPHLTTSD